MGAEETVAGCALGCDGPIIRCCSILAKASAFAFVFVETAVEPEPPDLRTTLACFDSPVSGVFWLNSKPPATITNPTAKIDFMMALQQS